MMVLTRNATVSCFKSGYDGPLATDGTLEQHAVDLMNPANSSEDLKKHQT